MANAGVEYMARRKPKGSNPVPLDNLSWVLSLILVAILKWEVFQVLVTQFETVRRMPMELHAC